MKQIRKRLTYANVMSSIAVFLVIGGATAFAALSKNSVGTKQLKANAVTTAKIKKEAVSTKKIKKNAVTGDQVNESTLGTVPSATNAATASTAANSGKLGGLAANELLRASTKSDSTNLETFESTSFTDVLSRSVTAPTGGILLIWGSLNFNVNNGSTKPAKTSVRGALDGTGATLEANGETEADSGVFGTSVSVSGAVPVKAGTHTVTLQARQLESKAYIEGRTLTTLFVPFGNTGEQGILGQ